MDPYTGRVFALSGGFDFNKSNFNRVIQAKDNQAHHLNHLFICLL